VHNGQAVLIWAAIALRMNALLFGSLFKNSASSASTLNATTSVFGFLCSMIALVAELLFRHSLVYRHRGDIASSAHQR
jgi:hypothetical protein